MEPEPQGRTRAIIVGLCCVWLAIHLLVPLRYYVNGDEYDERFAWRMFSQVRVRQCSAEVIEVVGDRFEPLSLSQNLPEPWRGLLQRNRPGVIEGVLRWRCALRDEADEVRFRSQCRSVVGEDLPLREWRIDCDTLDILPPEEGS